MDPTDQSNLHMLAQVLHQHMKKVGLNVDLQAMDWSTLVSRRAFRAAPSGLRLIPSPLHSDEDIKALVAALSDVWTRLTLGRAA
jgi:ABC-type transport system substrate-binding protein